MLSAAPCKDTHSLPIYAQRGSTPRGGVQGLQGRLQGGGDKWCGRLKSSSIDSLGALNQSGTLNPQDTVPAIHNIKFQCRAPQ